LFFRYGRAPGLLDCDATMSLRGGISMRGRCAVTALGLLAGCAQTPARPPAAEGAAPPATAAAAPRAAEAAADVNPFDACAQPDQDVVAVIDETRRRLQETVCGAVLWFDGLFGVGDIASARRTRGRIEASIAHSEFEGTRTRLRFNARVRLPALENRVSAFVGRDSDEDFIRDRSEGLGLRSQFPQVEDEEEWLAGLGYALPEKLRVKSEFRVGGRGVNPTKVFAQGRFSYTPYADELNVVHLRATPFVNNIDGLGLTASFDVSHALGPTRLLRLGNVGTVSEKTSGLDWRSALILYQNLREFRAIAFETFVRGATAAPEPLGEYGVRAIYRQPLVQQRLWLELIPGYSWPRVDPSLPREGSFGWSVGLEMPFGAG
jgi:hypothetical protein